jgi:gluconokinase
MVILLMGVAGAGKSTVGARLAHRLGWAFYDADDLHSRENIARMRSGQPLDDGARVPWLLAVRDLIMKASRERENAVVACSALKSSYRALILDGTRDVRLVHLSAPVEVLRERVAARRHHFMPSTLVDSQLATLEPPEEGVTIDATPPVQEIVGTIISVLGLSSGPNAGSHDAGRRGAD